MRPVWSMEIKNIIHFYLIMKKNNYNHIVNSKLQTRIKKKQFIYNKCEHFELIILRSYLIIKITIKIQSNYLDYNKIININIRLVTCKTVNNKTEIEMHKHIQQKMPKQEVATHRNKNEISVTHRNHITDII